MANSWSKKVVKGWVLKKNGKVEEGQCFCCTNSRDKVYEVVLPRDTDKEIRRVCQKCLRDNLVI